jgi:hypothetical protein
MKLTSPIMKLFRWQSLAILVMVGLALAIRVYDLDDPPFDFHPNRQFFTAIIARGEYYQHLTTAPDWMRNLAVTKWKIEESDFPTIDALAALTYRLIGREDIFFPRLYSALFWLLGGLPLYWLARELTSPKGALVALGMYWFLPYGIIASRSFMPDPLMTALTLFAWWAMLRWHKTNQWKWAFLAGLFSAAAMLVKVLAAFTLLGGMAGVFFARKFKESARNIQFWVMGAIAALPVIGWIIYNVLERPNFSGQFSLRFFPQLLADPAFWLAIKGMWENIIGLAPFVLALIGFFLYAQKEKRIFIACLWAGYFLFLLVFSYFFMTHDYYHISLVPITALTIAPLIDFLWEKLKSTNKDRLARAGLVLVLLFGLGANLWNVRQTLHKADYRPLAETMAKIGEKIGPNVSTVALTQDYAGPIFFYGWIFPAYWPYTSDDNYRALAGISVGDFTQRFSDLTAGKEYFIVTDFVEFDKQPQLKEFLSTHYPIHDEGDGYAIYDLLHPVVQP